MISVRNILHVKHSQYPGVDGYTPDEDSQVIPAVFIMPTTPGASCSGFHTHTFSFSGPLLLRSTETLASVH